MGRLVQGAALRHDEIRDDHRALTSMSYAISMNSLKVSAPTLVVRILHEALLICGLAGYREDSPYSLGRLLRDAHGAAVMINNGRILDNNARLLLIDKERSARRPRPTGLR
jgi:acyl-CoA dehydrogenase